MNIRAVTLDEWLAQGREMLDVLDTEIGELEVVLRTKREQRERIAAAFGDEKPTRAKAQSVRQPDFIIERVRKVIEDLGVTATGTVLQAEMIKRHGSSPATHVLQYHLDKYRRENGIPRQSMVGRRKAS